MFRVNDCQGEVLPSSSCRFFKASVIALSFSGEDWIDCSSSEDRPNLGARSADFVLYK